MERWDKTCRKNYRSWCAIQNFILPFHSYGLFVVPLCNWVPDYLMSRQVSIHVKYVLGKVDLTEPTLQPISFDLNTSLGHGYLVVVVFCSLGSLPHVLSPPWMCCQPHGQIWRLKLAVVTLSWTPHWWETQSYSRRSCLHNSVTEVRKIFFFNFLCIYLI